ncbi:MAG: type IV toxin-antitoxin system AbiEi family antitoxin domain-containing protein [Anaerolineae bacterium]|nr:type IV toxin-antitoxin system AbiEi family antitoxin domain-containing protein [Anaerolineae bacterium]
MNTQTNNKPAGLGSKAATLLTTLAGEGRNVFTTAEAYALLGGSRSATYKLLHDLVQGGWLHALDKGRYLIVPLEAGPERHFTIHEFRLAHHLAPEGYIAYWTALHHHGLTEQIPRNVWIATTRRRQPIVLLGVEYIFVTLRPYKLFGAQTVWIEGQAIAIADLEKSVVDALDHPEYCGGIIEVAKGLAVAVEEHGANLAQLTDYALKMRNGALFKRLGYLTERLSLPVGNYIPQWRAALTGGHALLDPGRPADGPVETRWRLRVNVSEAEIQGWQER